MTMLRIVAAALAALAVALPAPASSQDWPAGKIITIVAPVPPGPTVDLIARLQESLEVGKKAGTAHHAHRARTGTKRAKTAKRATRRKTA